MFWLSRSINSHNMLTVQLHSSSIYIHRVCLGRSGSQADLELSLSSCTLCNHQQRGGQYFVCLCTLANH